MVAPAGILIVAGSVPVIWRLLDLGWRTHMPSLRDTLVQRGLHAHLPHLIHAGGILIFWELALLKSTTTIVLAGGMAAAWLILQARLEEIDLLQRLPLYREYMNEVPRFVTRLLRRE